ncbi:MAG: hypothetical protein Tsb002_23170 [Wenzhouxiangellaceae bacterium]
MKHAAIINHTHNMGNHAGIATATMEQAVFEPLSAMRLHRAKRAYITRRVYWPRQTTLVTANVTPRAGDLVLARVTHPGAVGELELPHGRRSRLYPGDEVILSYAPCSDASDQIEAVIPPDLGECQLIASQGLAALYESINCNTAQPTTLMPLGLIGNEAGRPLNLADFGIPERRTNITRSLNWRQTLIVVVVGTSPGAASNASMTGMIRGLHGAGLKVTAGRLIGAGGGSDLWAMTDAGAALVSDCADCGHATTAQLQPRQMEQAFLTMLNHLSADQPDVAVLEIAAELYQDEAHTLLQSPVFRQHVDEVVLVAAEAAAAIAGVAWLREQQLPVMAISGLRQTSSRCAQAAQQRTGLPLLSQDQLCDAQFLPQLLFWQKELYGRRLSA